MEMKLMISSLIQNVDLLQSNTNKDRSPLSDSAVTLRRRPVKPSRAETGGRRRRREEGYFRAGTEKEQKKNEQYILRLTLPYFTFTRPR